MSRPLTYRTPLPQIPAEPSRKSCYSRNMRRHVPPLKGFHETRAIINATHEQLFEWNQNGNMTFHRNEQAGYDRRMCWDEQNRLLGVKDEGQRISYYLYDANGDRAYKFTGEYAAQNRSGQWHYYYFFDRPTLYASPYLVSNEKGYTKHYYAESERIASRIGGGGLQDLHKGFENDPDMVVIHKERSAKLFDMVMWCLDADAMHEEDALGYLYNWQEFVDGEEDCYWYHPDHLGSSSWITYTDGSAVQHLHYLPWGEEFVDQRSASWNAMYTFSAKEKDTETGYSYFGSRYYSSDLSIWLSVDPLADKYPSMSPYTYCADNPVKLVDPNGEEVDDPPAWKRINPVIPKELFVRWKEGADYLELKKKNGREPNCNDYAKHQLSKVDCYTTGGGDSRTLYPYSEASGVNEEHARKSVDYIHGQLEKGIPVFVGVDEGATSSDNNGTTDHFIVIVGQGSDKRGNYFLFYDNGTKLPERGTSSNNKLYYNEKTGEISGLINTRGVEQYYIISEVRTTNRRKR